MEKKQREEKNNITENNGDDIVGICILVGIVISSIATGIEFHKYVDSLYWLILTIIGLGIGGGGLIGTVVGCFIAAFFYEP